MESSLNWVINTDRVIMNINCITKQVQQQQLASVATGFSWKDVQQQFLKNK